MKKIVTLVLLLSQISLIAQDYKFGKVSKEEIQEKFYPLDSTADAAYLHRSRRTYYEYNSSSGWFDVITEVHNRIKVYTKEGFEKATQSIVYYKPDSGKDEKITSLKGYTFNLEGKNISKEKLSKKSIFDEKINKFKSRKKIAFPNIKEGCVIDVSYRIISPYYRYIDDLEFQFDIPVKNLEYKVEIPEYYKFKLAAKGYYFITPLKTTKSRSFSYTDKYRVDRGSGTRTVNQTNKINYRVDYSTYQGKNIPGLKDDEPFVFNIKNHRGGMKYELSSIDFVGSTTKYFSTTWEDVSKQVFKSDNFGGQINKSSYYKDDLTAILENTTTDSEKIVAIFQLVKEKVKWNGYYSKYADQGVRKAYKEGTGNVADINLMLTSMLRFAGLEANPVISSTRANGVPLFPTLDGLNYVIAMVEFPDGNYALLDASEPYSLPNILPFRALNWNGRKVTKEGNSSWVSLTNSKLGEVNNNVVVNITEELLVEGLIRTKLTNSKALEYRKDNNHLKEEKIITNLEEKLFIEIENYKLTGATNLAKSISRTIKFTSEDLIEEINGKIYINPLVFLSEKTNPFKLDNRQFPVEFDTPFRNKDRITIKIPEGYKIENLPETLAIGLPENLGVFKFQTSQVGGKITVISILQFNQAIIAPQYYNALKEFYGQTVKKQTEKIVFVKI
ncbi:transglutaminase domain-containing protein [Polaribacter sp.]|uniref:transglutaminase domain-containing protein n=1 Tax=Polaribacter sp. TaxID=1920175 RepID=UPI003EF291DA